MERTLTLETRALKATSRQWKELSPEMQRMISMWFVHQTAPLIKDLTFEYLEEGTNQYGIYWPHRTVVECPGTQYFTVVLYDERCRRFRGRTFYSTSFEDSKYDRYQIDSDRASDIVLGRVVGTYRWGDEQ